MIGPVQIMKRSIVNFSRNLLIDIPRWWGWERWVSGLNITLEVAASCPGRWAAGPDDGQRRRIGQEAPT